MIQESFRMKLIRGLLAAVVGGLLVANPLQAQARGAISGRVVDSTSQLPMQSVQVTIEGTQRGAVTRVDGGFLITDLPAGSARLRVARIGYKPQVRDVAVVPGQTANVRFVMSAVAANLGAVVVTGYGSQRKEAVTGSVVTIDADQANVGVIANPTALLTARSPGVDVVQNSGEPGAGAQIRIRGNASISASSEPLYVIDGVPIQNNESESRGVGVGGGAALGRNPLNAINPSDIASMTVLKDAAATAIYGSRGANGVVLIETKRGRAGAASMEYDTFVAAGQAANSLGFLSAAEYRQYLQSQGRSITGLGNADTNWEEAIRRTAITQNHNLAFSGGNQSTTFRASLNFQNNQGVIINNGFERLGARINGNHEALDGKLRVGLNVSSSRLQNQYVQAQNTGGFEGDIFTNAATFDPTQPIRNADGSFYEIGPGRQSLRNPVAIGNQLQDRGNTIRTLANLTTSYSIFPSLIAQVNVGLDRSNGQRNTYLPRASAIGAEWNGLARQTQRQLSNQNLQTLLTWSPTFGGDIDFDIVGGYEFTDFENADFAAESRNFITDAFGFDNLGAGSVIQPPSSYREPSRLVSFFSRANLAFKNKYFLTGVIRRDGSSRFGANNKWAVFPSLSASWSMHEEGFAKGLPFNQLKLRAGYGLQGNQAIPPFGSLATLAPDQGARYLFGSTIFTGIVPNVNPNPNLRWETSAQSNIALDYAFSDNRFSGTVELFNRRTTDLLQRIAVAQTGSSFVGDQLQNIGSMQNRGLEASLDMRMWDRPNNGFNLTSGLVLSVIRNKVLSLGPQAFIEVGTVSGQGQTGVFAQRLIPGQPIGSFFGQRFAGFQQGTGAQLFVNDSVTFNGDGTERSRTTIGTTTSPGAEDRVIIGNANPTFSLGLRSNGNWKNFDFSWLWRMEQGRDVFNNTALISGAKSNATNGRNFLRSSLSDPTPITEPAQYSSRFIENGSFLRLQNITAGYTFKLPMSNGARTARVFVAGDNLLLFTPYTGYDPEVFVDAAGGLPAPGIDYLTYPRPRTGTFGFRVSF
jgi:TonB-dependent starch-binding outer membrane protein SusC